MTAPLVEACVDLRGMPFMPLDVVRLLDSDQFAISTGDEFKAAVALWCRSFLQVPAASLPDDDRILAHLSGAGAGWGKVKEGAMRGWIKCTDGRWYHPVVAEKAAEAWKYRVGQRERAAKRWNKESNSGARAEAYSAAQATADATASATAMQGTVKGQLSKESKALSGGAPDDGVVKSGKPLQRREARAAGVRAIEYLNKKAGTQYRLTGANLNFPIDRILVDGASESDLLAVVDLKCKDVMAGDFDPKYLRPETLWNATKFGSYIGQVNTRAPAVAEANAAAAVHFENENGDRWKYEELPIEGECNPEAVARLVVGRTTRYMASKRVKGITIDFAGARTSFSVEELRRAH